MSHLQNHLQLFHVLESLWKTILRLETNLEEGKAVLVPVGEGIFVCVCVCMCVCVCVCSSAWLAVGPAFLGLLLVTWL